MRRSEAEQARRCRLLVLGMLFGILLPAFQPSWVTLGVAIVGEALLLFTWWRECASGARRDPAPPEP